MLQDIQFKSAQHVIDEVRNMNVKGGSPFGRAAAWAYSLACTQERFAGRADLTARFDDISSQLLALKPTMATIYNTKSVSYTHLQAHPDNVRPTRQTARPFRPPPARRRRLCRLPPPRSRRSPR